MKLQLYVTKMFLHPGSSSCSKLMQSYQSLQRNMWSLLNTTWHFIVHYAVKLLIQDHNFYLNKFPRSPGGLASNPDPDPASSHLCARLSLWYKP